MVAAFADKAGEVLTALKWTKKLASVSLIVLAMVSLTSSPKSVSVMANGLEEIVPKASVVVVSCFFP